MSDGKVTIKTKLDKSGVRSGVNELRSELRQISPAARDAGRSASNDLRRIGREASNAGRDASRSAREAANDSERSSNRAASVIKTAAHGVGTAVKGVASASGHAIVKGAEMGAKACVSAAKMATAGLGAAAVGVGAIVTQSLSAYSSYEQNIGGIAKLYGAGGQSIQEYAASVGKSVNEVTGEYGKLTEAQNLVVKNAKQAYKTAGMDANTYMENATQFSASLINSLGGDTVAAAKQTDKAMRLMSDNVNTFGSNADDVSNAIKGLARNNFSMLDNLKLGYSGSKEGMQQLIADANEYGKTIGMTKELSIDSFSDMIDAIDLIQQKQGIAGTTAKEATKTIEGSLNMTKAAWSNLMTAMGSGEGVDEAINALVESFGHLTDNVLPVIEKALSGIGKALPKFAGKIGNELPKLMSSVLPSLLDAAVSLVNSFGNNLPSLVGTLSNTLSQSLPLIITTIMDLAPQLLACGGKIIASLADGLLAAIPTLAEQIPTIIQNFTQGFVEHIDEVVSVATDIILALVNGLIAAIPALAEAVPQIIESLLSAIVENAPALIEAGWNLIVALGIGLISAIGQLLADAGNVLLQLVSKVGSFAGQMLSKGAELMRKVGSGISNAASHVKNAVANAVRGAVSKVGSFVSDMAEAGLNLIKGMGQGILNAKDWLCNKVRELCHNAIDAIKSFFGIHSPATKHMPWLGEMMARGIGKGFAAFDLGKDINASLDSSLGRINTNMTLNAFGTGGYNGGVVYNQTINVNKGIATPSDIAREIRLKSRLPVLGV